MKQKKARRLAECATEGTLKRLERSSEEAIGRA
jgi:hypothetical protein